MSWHKGGGNKIKTPYLESLADSGTKLENYYIYRFCSPSRSTFMTGRHPSHVGQQVLPTSSLLDSVHHVP